MTAAITYDGDLFAQIDKADKKTRKTKKRVADDPAAERDYQRFIEALDASVGPDGLISQNVVRLHLVEETIDGPRCAIKPERYAAFFGRAKSEGRIEKIPINDGRFLRDVATTSFTGNNGKDQLVWRWLA